MTIKLYRNTPFDGSTETDLIDQFTGDGVLTSFVLTNKTGIRVGGIIEFDALQFLRYAGGFTVSGNTVTLDEAPPAASSGVVPGLSCLTFSAFNTDDVDGVTAPRVDEQAFYIGNGTDVYLEYYTGLDDGGIRLSFVNLIDIAGLADTSWMQLASAQESTGDPGTYQVTGEAIYTPAIQAFGTLAQNVTSLSTSITVCSTDTWQTGDYILFNPGESNSEIVKTLTQSGSPDITFTTTELNYDHFAGENIFTCVRKFWAKLTVPDGAGSPPNNFINVCPRLEGISKARF